MVSIDSFYSPPPKRVGLFDEDAKVDEVFNEGLSRYIRREMDRSKRGRLSSRRLVGISKGIFLGFRYAIKHCGSVPEKVLLAAAAWTVGLKGWQIPSIWPWPDLSHPTCDVTIVPQQPVTCSSFLCHVDFGIYARQTRLAVEVDGHEFHEKTKEQAARNKRRDRELQQEGWAVFRFTGTEVWRDPFGCCDVINKFIQREMPVTSG